MGLVASGSPAPAYQAIPVADGGSIAGKVVYQGAVPMRKIIPTKDQEVCGDIREEPQIVVGPDKGVPDVIVYLKQVDKGKPWPTLEQPPEIVNRQCRFVPFAQAFPVGSEVVVVNDDPVFHNTRAFLGRLSLMNVGLPNQGQRIPQTIRRAGIIRIECDAHGWMQAWAYAADNPYYAVTDPNGAFTIADVPPGTYRLAAWHAFTGETESPVTVKAKEVSAVTIELRKK
jgi:hypothetical protein